MDANRRAELKAFLRSVRSRLTPEAVGLPAAGRRRRAPGLRIEETAAVAGVSLTWYSALEGGKDVRVSTNVLTRLGNALHLTSEERELLASLTGPQTEAPAPDPVDPLLMTIVDGFTAGPAYVSDRFWNVLAFNGLADTVYEFSHAPERNLLVRMFAEPEMRRLHADWERIARQMVAILHLSFGHAAEDARAIALITSLRATSDEFATWWDNYELSRFVPTQSVLHHSTIGRLTLTFTSFVTSAITPSDDPLVIVLQPAADESTRFALTAARAG